MRWDPGQYGRYADERGRPFVDLVGRIGCETPRRVVDVGCGPGNMTALLAQRWPNTTVEGFDGSAEMIAAAGSHAASNVSFRVQDAQSWSVPGDADVVVSNATLQRVKSHRDLLRRWAAELPAGGWVAFQVPSAFNSPAHTLLRELALSPPYVERAGAAVRTSDAVDEPRDYAALLLDAGLTVDVWETTYLHLLQGADPVLEWIRGTRLQPVLDTLPDDQAKEFEDEFADRLRSAYPVTPYGTLLPYRRVFAVGHKPS
jgi:trans-aconitate 2-methyltransferase